MKKHIITESSQKYVNGSISKKKFKQP